MQNLSLIEKLTVFGIGLFIFGGLAFTLLSGNKSQSAPTALLSTPVSEKDNSKGPFNSNIELVEYSDFQCPACGLFQPVLKQLESENKNIKFVFRNFPLTSIHKNAEIAAYAAEASALQGKFWEMHDKLYENQDEWSYKTFDEAKTIFIGFAKNLGLNEEQFIKDIDSDIVIIKVADDYKTGTTSGVDGTPSFFLNGIKIQNPASYEEFKKIIEAGTK